MDSFGKMVNMKIGEIGIWLGKVLPGWVGGKT
jgi:hypothetical protein